MIRAVLFDIGETLVTSLENEEIHQLILREKGIERKTDEIKNAIVRASKSFNARHDKKALMAMSLDDFYVEWDSEVYKEMGFRNWKAMGKYAHKRWFELAGLRMYDDVMPVLNRLSASGIKIGLVTNGYYEEAKEVMERVSRTYIKGELKRLGVPESMFSVIVGRDTTGAQKPDPRPFLHAAGALGLRPDEIIFVGNSYKADYEGSQGAGMSPILILRGNALPENAPDDITSIQTLDELVKFIR